MRVKTGLAAAAAVLLVLASCDGGEDVSTPSRRSTSAPQAPEGGRDAQAQAPAPDVEDYQRGGTITVLAETVPVTFDPTRMSSPDELAIMSLVTRSLTQYRYNPRIEQMVLVPDLATDLGRPNADFTKWTFTLRSGLRYADGADVSAADVAYAIKRSFATKQLPGGFGYNTEYFLGGDSYQGPFTDGRDFAGVEVEGDSITISMRRPFVDMPHYAAFPTFTPIPAGADTRPQAYGMRPLATGPYQFESYKPGVSLVLTRNEYWDPASDPARHQYPDRWDFRFGVNANLIDDELIDDVDEAQTTASYTDVQPENYPLTTLDDELSARVVTGSAPCTYLWYLDMRTITSLDVRKAIGLAFPYRQYWRAQNHIEGVTRIPATTILPPSTNGRVDYDVLGNAGARTDPEAARDLLENADEIGFELRFAYEQDNPDASAAREVVATALEKAGFTVTPVPADEADGAAVSADPSAPVNMRTGEWCADWPSGSLWFPEQWAGGLIKLDGVRNPSFLDRPDVDAMIRDISNDGSDSEPADAWGRLDRYIQQTYYPAIPVGYAGKALMHGSRVGGMTINAVRGMPNFTDMFVESR